VQIFQMDKSYGADGMAVRGDIKIFADLKGKTIAVDAPGTAPYFGLAWMLKQERHEPEGREDVTLSPQAAANAFVAGRTTPP
jgi:NitT/TauT family transport system substrate-binding protein